MKTYAIAAIPGDGIGTEVIAAGVEVLHALAQRDGSFTFKVDHFDWGSEYYKKHGIMMPENGRDQIKGHDAILFGSAGAPDVPDHITLWGLRLAICQPFDQYANVRPTRILPGSGSRSASRSINTPMCDRPASCPASPARCATFMGQNSTGSSSAKTRKANMPEWAAASTRDCRSRSRPTSRS
jgi:hypothetical protein